MSGCTEILNNTGIFMSHCLDPRGVEMGWEVGGWGLCALSDY